MTQANFYLPKRLVFRPSPSFSRWNHDSNECQHRFENHRRYFIAELMWTCPFQKGPLLLVSMSSRHEDATSCSMYGIDKDDLYRSRSMGQGTLRHRWRQVICHSTCKFWTINVQCDVIMTLHWTLIVHNFHVEWLMTDDDISAQSNHDGLTGQIYHICVSSLLCHDDSAANSCKHHSHHNACDIYTQPYFEIWNLVSCICYERNWMAFAFHVKTR